MFSNGDRTILVPIDLSLLGETKIPVVEECARAFNANVLLLHVLPVGAIDPTTVLPNEATARTYLDTLVAHLRAAGLPAQTLLRSGAAAATIVQEARLLSAGLILLGTTIRGTLPRVVLGSVADQVVRTAPCPVLLVHPDSNAPRSSGVRSFLQDAQRVGALVQRNLGVRTIDVARIVGSVGRHKELGLDFRPPKGQRRKGDEQRFEAIRNATEMGAPLPAIDVYKLGFGYYVLDGHHRVAAARANRQTEIEANVAEFVQPTDDDTTEVFRARRSFERTSGLTEVGASRSETYAILLRAIEAYRAEHGWDDLTLAARRWFGEVYTPLRQAIRARELHTAFPGDRSADIIARVVVWRETSAQPAASWESALEALVLEDGADRRSAGQA
jgi:nucleotide-binding universal stress UspA family protein